MRCVGLDESASRSVDIFHAMIVVGFERAVGFASGKLCVCMVVGLGWGLGVWGGVSGDLC